MKPILFFILLVSLTRFLFPGPGILPDFAAKMEPYAQKIYINENGYWEAEFKFGIKLVYIPAGEFRMGSPSDEEGREFDEGPLHQVYLDGYWMGKYEITQEIWTMVMGHNPSHFKNAGKNAPVESVSWNDTQRFIDKIGRLIGTTFKLPSEAQWEKACRGGSHEATYGPLDAVAWYYQNAGPKPLPVGTKHANFYGLYDMLGNVWEWTADWYKDTYYTRSPHKNPHGPTSGERRTVRGGSFMHEPSYIRCGHRNNYPPHQSILRLGFRIAKPEF